MRAPAPSRHRMNRFAVEILEVAERNAKDEAIRPGVEVRLALSWLVVNRIAEVWQADLFWKALTIPPLVPDVGMSAYCRRRDMFTAIGAWKRKAKL